MRDETDLNGLKLTIDLKRGADGEKLMARLMRSTTLQDSVSCNFNVLVAGMPRSWGCGSCWRSGAPGAPSRWRRRVYFTLGKKKDKLHLLKGLKRILLDIDKAIRIIRETEEEALVIPNLMIGFGIDEIQAEYVAEIKLRNINKEYILKRVEEEEALRDEIDDLENTLNSPQRLRKLIIGELEDVKRKYAVPRRTDIVYAHEVEETPEEEETPGYPVHLFLSREGYFKKITPASPAHGRRAEVQGGGRPLPVLPGPEPGRGHVLHRQVPGVQDPPHRVRRHQGQRPGGLPALEAGDGGGRARGVLSPARGGLRGIPAVFLWKTARPPRCR